MKKAANVKGAVTNHIQQIHVSQEKNAKHYILMSPISVYGCIITLNVHCQKNFCYLKLDFSCYVNEEDTFIGNA